MGYHAVMTIRLQDIADEAGVSQATVSRVLNNKDGVATPTRESVLVAAELLGYDRPAPSKPQRTRLVGIIVPELDNPIFALFVQHLESALSASGYTPLLCTASPVAGEQEYLETLLHHDVAGIVFITGRHANREVDHSRYTELRGAGRAMVLVNGYVQGVDAPFISSDDVASMHAAVEHLVSLGHRRIGCAMGPARYAASQRKVAGFLEAMGRVPPGGNATAIDPRELVSHTIYTVEGGQAAAQPLLDEGVTAIVCGSDLMALGAIRAARGRGLEVPRDLSVVGYDDSPLIPFCDPPLTTIRQDVVAMCEHTVQTLVDELEGQPHPRNELLFPTELVVRRSTGPPPDRQR